MRRVLRELEFVDSNDIVTMKGCVACEITTADELVAAELLFQNVFETLEVEAICAMLSCLVFQEKHDEPEPTDEILLKCTSRCCSLSLAHSPPSPYRPEKVVRTYRPVQMRVILILVTLLAASIVSWE